MMKIEQITNEELATLPVLDVLMDNNVYVVRLTKSKTTGPIKVGGMPSMPYGLSFKQIVKSTPEIIQQILTGEVGVVRVSNE